MKYLVLVLSLVVFASCTKKKEPVVKDTVAFAEEACFSIIKEGVKMHNSLLVALDAQKPKPKTKPAPLFNNAELEQKIKEEFAKPGLHEKAFVTLEPEITKVDPTFATQCKDGFKKFLTPCAHHTDKPSFEGCFAAEFKKDEAFAKDLIGRVAAQSELEKLKK